MTRKIPILYYEKSDCCGCGACYSICTKGAINIQYDTDGFQYPVINENVCIRCYLCLKVCPFKNFNNKEGDTL